MDLRRCLVEPYVQQLENYVGDGSIVSMWVVLKEDPVKNSRYMIVYDETEQLYGLATTTAAGVPVFIGFYGTFLETLDGM